jgi:hypothetical protein
MIKSGWFKHKGANDSSATGLLIGSVLILLKQTKKEYKRDPDPAQFVGTITFQKQKVRKILSKGTGSFSWIRHLYLWYGKFYFKDLPTL